MLQAGGPVLGETTPVSFVARCSEMICGRKADAHHETLRMMLALGHARAQGMYDALDDPFIHTPKAKSKLQTLVDRLQAQDTVAPEDWRSMYDDGARSIAGGSRTDPALLCASLLQLYAFAVAEDETLALYAMAAGADEEAASRISSPTVAAGTAACLTGGFRSWASKLARTNSRALHGMNGDSAEACRVFQAAALKRFAKIEDLDGIEGVIEEQAAQGAALKQLIQITGCENQTAF